NFDKPASRCPTCNAALQAHRKVAVTESENVGRVRWRPAPPILAFSRSGGISMDLQLAGRRVLVTGASKGIGLAVARSFAAEGCAVNLAARDRDELDRVAGE